MAHDGINHGGDSQVGKAAPAMDHQQHAFNEVQGQMAGPAGAGMQNQIKDSMSAGSTASQSLPKVELFDSQAGGAGAAGLGGTPAGTDAGAGESSQTRQNYMLRHPVSGSQNKPDPVAGEFAGS